MPDKPKRKGGPGRIPKSMLKGREPLPARPKRSQPRSGRTATKRTPARMARVLLALSRGHTRRAAAALAGIHDGTLYDWTNDDAEFAEACDIAESTAEAQMVEALAAVASSGLDWKATLAWLEHRRRVDWKPPTATTEVSGPDGGPINLADARTKIAGILDRYAATSPTAAAAGEPESK